MAKLNLPNKTKQTYYYTVGRHKTAVATLRLKKGSGKILVNDLEAANYFNNQTLIHTIHSPLILVGMLSDAEITVRVRGGGKSSQAKAICLAIARALAQISDQFKLSLRKAGYLTRDSRRKERKKYGLKKARKAPQFSKR